MFTEVINHNFLIDFHTIQLFYNWISRPLLVSTENACFNLPPCDVAWTRDKAGKPVARYCDTLCDTSELFFNLCAFMLWLCFYLPWHTAPLFPSVLAPPTSCHFPWTFSFRSVFRDSAPISSPPTAFVITSPLAASPARRLYHHRYHRLHFQSLIFLNKVCVFCLFVLTSSGCAWTRLTSISLHFALKWTGNVLGAQAGRGAGGALA